MPSYVTASAAGLLRSRRGAQAECMTRVWVRRGGVEGIGGRGDGAGSGGGASGKGGASTGRGGGGGGGGGGEWFCDESMQREPRREGGMPPQFLPLLVSSVPTTEAADDPQLAKELPLQVAHWLSGAAQLLSGLGLSMGRPAPEHHEHASMGRAVPQHDDGNRRSLVSSTSPPPSPQPPSSPAPPSQPLSPPQPPRPPPRYPPFQPPPSPSPTPPLPSPPFSPPPGCPEGYHRVDGSIKDNCAECQLGTYQDQNESMVLSCYPCPFHTFAPTMGMRQCIRELARLARPINPAHTAADALV